MKKRYVLITIILVVFAAACNYDKLPTPNIDELCNDIQPTYEIGVKEIINRSCAYAGCHVAGFNFGDYSNFQSLSALIPRGRIESRSTQTLDMPPSYAPDDRPKSLTAQEIAVLKCWFAAGTPEK
jgi:hypothetical protein